MAGVRVHRRLTTDAGSRAAATVRESRALCAHARQAIADTRSLIGHSTQLVAEFRQNHPHDEEWSSLTATKSHHHG